MHPSKAALLRFFKYAHLKDIELQEMSRKFSNLAHEIADFTPDNAESTTALRKLLEAKDCAVRSLLPED